MWGVWWMEQDAINWVESIGGNVSLVEKDRAGIFLN